MSATLKIKSIAENLPLPLAKLAAHVPHSLMLGPKYKAMRRTIDMVEHMSTSERSTWLFARLCKIVEHAWTNNKFYQHYWQRHGFQPQMLKSFEHFDEVPVVRKSDLAAFSIDDRSRHSPGSLRINTGGTSGEPLEFYIDRHAFAREWAHMHRIWFAAGYRTNHLKLTFRGRNLGPIAAKYNAIHNEVLVNTYADKAEVAEALQAMGVASKVKWLHGYPSVIADFCSWFQKNAPDLLGSLRGSLHGVLLGSEFPAPHYVDMIERTASSHIVSWYGHSEMAALAWRPGSKEFYRSFPSYGYAEAIEFEGETRLVATSLWNTSSHFIRYDTGDGVEALGGDGSFLDFCVTDGRVGEFVVDKKGQKIGLTALVFGRHHEAFQRAAHIQVRQVRQGHMIIVFVPVPGDDPTIDDLKSGFDLSFVDLDIDLEIAPAPYRTRNGKTPILVGSNCCTEGQPPDVTP